MRAYIRCCIANRFTLAGYINILAGLLYGIPLWLKSGLIHQDDLIFPFCVFSVGASLLFLTASGLETLETYRRVLRITLAEHRIDLAQVARENYCDRVGARLALRDGERMLRTGAGK